MAVKKKSAAKKVAKKAPAKRAVKKTAKKSVAKKATAKRVVKKTAKKAPAKKATAKRAVKKSVAKKATAKKSAVKKKVAKKAPAKRAVKKSSARAVVAVSTTPIAPVAPKPVVLAPKPVAAPKQSTSGRVVFLVVAGIVILAAIVWSKSADKNDDASPAPSISQSAEPTESATTEPTESATTEPTESATTVTAVEAPSKFVALKSADGLKLRWIAPTAVDGLTGFNVEVRANGSGDWVTIATVPADQLTQNVMKSGDAGWTQFRVTSVYSDGQLASATVFGIPGEFK
ncbi:MAG: hypothetical protein F2703_02650 [Actinobacteria bacterium]|uniref:Unannotated protein n=1 Tax=freshwater metagenome TaxID=449393 RepID=A0A6J6TDS8_9ZZZZ|nr:hypothetical protein [Actinomycetota bacterium]